MEAKIRPSMDEAVADIADGASIMVAGFGPGTPWNLLRALYLQGARDLTLICNTAVRIDPEDIQGIGTIIGAGRVRKVIASFTAATHPSRQPAFERLYNDGLIDAELTPQGTLAERIRAGGAGIPAFYVPAGVGTELAEGKEQRSFNGRGYVLEEALTADYALLRAWKADTFGNLIYRLAQRNFNPIMAMAARCAIAEVEEPIVAEGELDPDQVHTSGIFIKRLIQIPPPPAGILHVDINAVPVSQPAPDQRER